MERRVLGGGLLLALVLLTAANLRAVISSVGPVLPVIGHDTGMSPTELGVLVAVPVMAFAVVSPLVHLLATALGVDRTLLLALGLLAGGVALRSSALPGSPLWPLFAGTAALGSAIAIANVLLPVLVRRDFPARVPSVTGYYIAVQSLVAGVASGFAVPIAAATGSWRLAIGVWAVLLLPALALGTAIGRRRAIGRRDPRPASVAPSETPPVDAAPVWRSVVAWQVAGYFGLQSTVFYVLLSWLPTVEQDMGIPPGTAGAHLAVYLVVGITANVAVSRFLTIRGDQRIAAAGVAGCVVIAMAGMLLLPSLTGWWVALSGLAVGAAMVISLSLISLRGGDPPLTSRLSAMVQATAYTGVGMGLLAAGLIRDLAGPGRHLLGFVLLLGVLLLLLGLRVGRSATVADGPLIQVRFRRSR